MIKCAVLGSPISHSLSPVIHRLAYEELGIEGTYEAIDVDKRNFPAFFEKAKRENWTGFSLTMPLKEMAAEYADQIDDLVKVIRSANTLLKVENRWVAISTDALAFKSLIDLPRSARVKIIGGGGTARAALGALSTSFEKIEIYIRSNKRELELKSAAGNCAIEIKNIDDLDNSGDLIISTLPKGALDSRADKLANGQGILFDVLYDPWPTQVAAQWSGQIISGHELLVEQAMYQITFMTGADFNYHLMRGRLLGAIK